MKLVVITTENEIPSIGELLEGLVREIYLYWEGDLALRQILPSLLTAAVAVTESVGGDGPRLLPQPVEALARAMAWTSMAPDLEAYAVRLRSCVQILAGYHADQILKEEEEQG